MKAYRYQSASSAVIGSGRNDQWADVYHSEPARAASVGSDVAVPALQSLISGVVAGAVGLAACWAFGWSLRIAGAVGLAVLALTWVLLLVDHRRLLWAVESLTRGDINGDGAIGEPARLILEVKHNNNDRQGFDFLHLGIAQPVFLQWAGAVVAGRSLAVASWVGRGGSFSRSQYDAMLAELERAGIVARDGESSNAAWVLTAAGRETLRACVREYANMTTHTVAHVNSGGGESGQAFGAFVIVIGLVCVVALGAVFIGDALKAAQAAAAAKATEAQAVLVEAQASLAEAQARIAEAEAAEVEAENDRLLHEAAAYSIQKQADLVSYYAVRGDLRTIFMLLSVLVVIGVLALGRAALRRWDQYQAVAGDNLVSTHCNRGE